MVKTLSKKFSDDYPKGVDGKEPTYCDICYTNEIVAPGSKVPETSKSTIEFSCKHRFCQDCSRESIKELIKKGEFGQIKCLQFKCETMILQKELETLFGERDTEVYDKFKKFR